MTLTEGVIIAFVAGTVSIVTALIAAALQGVKWNSGERQQITTDTSLKLVVGIRKELDEMREEVDALRKENKELTEKLEELEDVKDWAERLVHQVKSLGHEPVKMRVRTARA